MLKDTRNTLGTFLCSADQTKLNKFTSYARICVYMHIAKALLDAINLIHEDSYWVQLLDYEHVPFRCRKCHEHGHLFRECPNNNPIGMQRMKLKRPKFSKDKVKNESMAENLWETLIKSNPPL